MKLKSYSNLYNKYNKCENWVKIGFVNIFNNEKVVIPLGTAFSMRNDLPIKLALISKDILDYARKGSKIMIKYKWMEQPPQMEDRNNLTKYTK